MNNDIEQEEKEDIDPIDENGLWHGYQEWYSGGKVWVRCTHKHGKLIGYKETHHFLKTQFHIK